MAPFDANQLQPPWITNQQHAPWVPLETKKDCSQGICSIYCPQLCYTVFPPPPPFFSFDEDNDNSSSAPSISPLVIAIIGILASAILLVSYYTIISKYCGRFRRPRLHLDSSGPNNDHVVNVEEQEEEEEEEGEDGDDDENQFHHHDIWHVSRSNGLDEALINKITVCKYKRGDGLVEGTDCSVCLSEFQEEESLRLLPKCSHAFHLQCIDTWLRSHSNCPLCRANIVPVNPLPPPQLPSAPPRPLQSETSHPETEGERNAETVVVIEDSDEANYEHEDIASKETSEGQEENQSAEEIIDSDDEDNNDGVESDGRSFSMDSSHISIVSIADIIMQRKKEDESKFAKDNGFVVGSGSCSQGRGEKSRSRNFDCVSSPVLMKRTASTGNSVLPIE